MPSQGLGGAIQRTEEGLWMEYDRQYGVRRTACSEIPLYSVVGREMAGNTHGAVCTPGLWPSLFFLFCFIFHFLVSQTEEAAAPPFACLNPQSNYRTRFSIASYTRSAADQNYLQILPRRHASAAYEPITFYDFILRVFFGF